MVYQRNSFNPLIIQRIIENAESQNRRYYFIFLSTKKNYPFQFISLQSNIHNLTIQLTFFQPKKKSSRIIDVSRGVIQFTP